MSRLLPWDEEAHAAEIVANFLDGAAEVRDPGGGAEQLHDFDVKLSDGTTTAVEVTRHTVSKYLRLLAAIDSRNWHFQELQRNWVVDMIRSYDVREVHGKIAAQLVALEAAGIETLLLRGALFDRGLTDDELYDDERSERAQLSASGTWEPAQRLYELGARNVYLIGDADEPGGGLVIMGDSPQAGSTGASVVVELCEYHASLPDNAKKLAQAVDANERHLFIWVEHSHDQAVAAFAFPSMPDRVPNLPDHVDAVWAVTAFDRAHIWQYHRAHGWRDLGKWSRPD
jgi:hypothetical protein